ncbi:MAG: hypothetical protein ABSC57_12140, partial [Syntrophales bacterium]
SKIPFDVHRFLCSINEYLGPVTHRICVTGLIICAGFLFITCTDSINGFILHVTPVVKPSYQMCH